MQISLETSTASTGELTALIALLASLGGRLPAGVPLATVRIDGTEAARPTRAALSEQPDDSEDPAALPIAGALDSTGVPWDVRIHSTPASLTKDGAYRKRRGISEVEFGRIHGELAEQAMPDPNLGTGTTTSGAASPQSDTAATPDAPPPPDDNDAPPPPADDGPNGASAPTAGGSAAQGAADAAKAGDGSRFEGFPAFVSAVKGIRPAPGIPFAELNTFAGAVGVPGGFKDMRLHPELWDDFFVMAGGQ